MPGGIAEAAHGLRVTITDETRSRLDRDLLKVFKKFYEDDRPRRRLL